MTDKLPKLQMKIKGVESTDQLAIVAEVTNKNLDGFNEYLREKGQDDLAGWERMTIRTYVAWNLFRNKKEKKDGNKASNPPHV